MHHQEILDITERAIDKIRDCAHQEQFILNSKEFDNIYLQVLNLLERKRSREESLLNRS